MFQEELPQRRRSARRSGSHSLDVRLTLQLSVCSTLHHVVKSFHATLLSTLTLELCPTMSLPRHCVSRCDLCDQVVFIIVFVSSWFLWLWFHRSLCRFGGIGIALFFISSFPVSSVACFTSIHPSARLQFVFCTSQCEILGIRILGNSQVHHMSQRYVS